MLSLTICLSLYLSISQEVFLRLRVLRFLNWLVWSPGRLAQALPVQVQSLDTGTAEALPVIVRFMDTGTAQALPVPVWSGYRYSTGPPSDSTVHGYRYSTSPPSASMVL